MLEEAPDEAPPTCFHHTDRPTGRRCTRCGRPACPDCLREASVGSHCWECVKAAAPSRRERARWRLAAEPLIVAKTLIGLNLAAYVWFALNGADVLSGGLSPGDPRVDWALIAVTPAGGGEWYRIFSSGFVHYGFIHIGFNMLILYQVATVLERVAGHVRFALIYVVSLVGGALGALYLDPFALTGGASGAVFGVAGAATLVLYRRGIPFMRTAFGPLVALNLLLGLVLPRVSMGGHLGGLAVGALAGWLLIDRGDTPTERRAAFATVVVFGLVLFAAAYWLAQNPEYART